MRDLPIPFSAPMVLALLAGRKTETRRLLAPAERCNAVQTFEDENGRRRWVVDPIDALEDEKPLPVRYAIGDHLYVREEIEAWESGPLKYTRFSADKHPTFHPWPEDWQRFKARPMHMFKRFSRMTLIVDDVRVERLQDISEADAIAEGIHCHTYGELAAAGLQSIANGPTDADRKLFTAFDVRAEADCLWATARDAYRELWDHLNESRGAGWETNPWVSITRWSKVIHQNVERIPHAS